jgi:hypothetical protein
VTDSSSTGITWSVAGVKGGNSKAGTITSAGLYKAPAKLPEQNSVEITATSTTNPKISATTYVYILARGPRINAVSPNPLNVGAFTTTIKGSGFRSGAVVFDTVGDVPVQLVILSVTPTTITATGYQGPAASASFSVKNPGSVFSNSITVPVAYTLDVVNGTGSGAYAAGKVVTINANAAPAGQSFLNWTGATVNNPGKARTSLTMPEANTTVTANYSTPAYTLDVVNGTGSGAYAAGQVVTIKANAPPAGQSFLNWTGAAVSDPSQASTTLIMPAGNTTVTANYSTPAYTLNVVNGTGSGAYAAGSVVSINANAAPAGQSFLNWTGAAVSNPNQSATTLTMPAADTTVTANYSTPAYTLNVVNGTGSGAYAAGSVVTINANAAPAGQSFLNWTGAAVSNPNQAATTLTMPAANTIVTANYSTPTASIPYPVSSHPRLWITTNDLPRLQSWATASNPIYQQGMLPLLNQAVSIYETQFFPNGVANPVYPDPGDVQGYSGYLTEAYGIVLAFNSLIDPSPTSRIQYAQYARNMLMVAMNQAALGHLANAPFRDPMFAVYNRANGSGEQWPLIVDWIYNAVDGNGNPILTAGDKATIRNVFLIWANDCLNASTTGGDHPAPVGVTNDPQLLPNNAPYRMAANNYYLGHARLLTMMGLSIDPDDDPPVNGSAPASQLGNTIRSYIPDANGAWLYQEFAMFGDPSVVTAAYGLPGSGAGFGLASGGLPPEGMLYGHSFSFILGQLLALQTAGFNDQGYSGPQIQLIGAPIWDRYVIGYISSLTPTAQTFSAQPWLGPVYQYGSYGDLLRLWVTPDFMQPFSLLALLDQQNGKTAHLNSARWFAVNATEGGPNALMSRITSPWSYSSTSSILYFLLLDPAAPAATDPRPAFPTTFYDPPAGRIVAHSDWSANNTMFDYRASWISINHQDGDGGQFEFYRNGEWLTKEMSNYDNNCLGMTTMYHNTLALQNWSPNGTPDLNWYEYGEWANGSQWMEGMDAGDPTTITSSGPNYVYATSDLTNLFNRYIDIWSPNTGANDITQATRSIIWLNNDYIVVYDRAASLHPGLFKRFNLCLVNDPAIIANVAIETMDSGQQLFVQTLLPSNPQITAAFDVSNLNPVAQLEPTQYVLTVEDPSMPTDVRFLHVLQGADPGVAMAAAAYLKSTGGTAFDGAAFGGAAVYFPVSGNGAFTGTTLSAPTGVNTVLVAGLAAKTSYVVGIQSNGSGNVISISPGSTGTITDEAGLLRLTF